MVAFPDAGARQRVGKLIDLAVELAKRQTRIAANDRQPIRGVAGGGGSEAFRAALTVLSALRLQP